MSASRKLLQKLYPYFEAVNHVHLPGGEKVYASQLWDVLHHNSPDISDDDIADHEEIQATLSAMITRLSADYSRDRQKYISILGPEIEARRKQQDQKWGGPSHDDEHVRVDWCRLIQKYELRARKEIGDFDDNMFDIAALAVAAIQSSRRKRQ